MAKNKNSMFKNGPLGGSKDSTSNSSKDSATSSSGGSMKVSHSQVPDDRPARSGPGGE